MTKKPFSTSRLSSKRFLDSSGFTIIEVMIAAAIMAVLSLGFAEFTNHQNLAIKGNRALAERDALTNRLSRIAADPTGLIITANDSSNMSNQFHDCVLGGTGATACNTATCSAAAPCGLTLFDSTNTVVAGPPANPKYYDLNGAPCTPVNATDTNCAIQAITEYFPSCGVGIPSCMLAQNITVKYTVQPRPGILLSAGPMMKPAVNSIVTMIPLSGGKFGAWIAMSTASGAAQTAPADGFLMITSGFNNGVRVSTSGVQRLYVSARSTYGQGYVAVTMPISAAENFVVESTDIHDAMTGTPLTSVFFRALQ